MLCAVIYNKNKISHNRKQSEDKRSHALDIHKQKQQRCICLTVQYIQKNPFTLADPFLQCNSPQKPQTTVSNKHLLRKVYFRKCKQKIYLRYNSST